MTEARALPVRVAPVRRETVDSYWSRLCSANAIPPHVLWRSLRRADPTLPLGITPRQASRLVEDLGGVPRGLFGNERRATVCGHVERTQRVRCPHCRMLPPPESLCRRCTSGEIVFVARPAGPICIRHRRWHHAGVDIDVSGIPGLRWPQRQLNGTLRLRGIGYRSAAVVAAHDLLALWRKVECSTADADADADADANADADRPMEIRDFRVVVSLAVALTDPQSLQTFALPSLGRKAQAILVDSLVRRVLQPANARTSPDSGTPLAFRDRELRIDSAPSRAQGELPLSVFGAALVPRMPTVRARLLRHRDSWSAVA